MRLVFIGEASAPKFSAHDIATTEDTVMGLFGPSKAELEQDQAVFELMCLIAQVDGDFSEKEMAGIGQRILTLGEGKSFFKSWTKKGELQQERLDEAIRQFQTKSISLESGASIVTSIEPLLDDYKDAIKKSIEKMRLRFFWLSLATI